MHLSARQLDRFFDLLDSLLVFANRRLSLVDKLDLPIVGEEAEMKAALVCEMLWGNREVIEEFVRANPNGLSARDLQAVAAWNDALVGDFTLVEHAGGRTLMMHDTGIYAVCGLDRDLSERLPQAPDILHAVLLPFEGLIVTDGLEMGSGFPLNQEELQAMRADYGIARQQGIVATAEGLRERAAEYNRIQRELAFDELMASVEREARQSRDGEQLPQGYHRGVLAGLSNEEREKALNAYYDKIDEEAKHMADAADSDDVADSASRAADDQVLSAGNVVSGGASGAESSNVSGAESSGASGTGSGDVPGAEPDVESHAESSGGSHAESGTESRGATAAAEGAAAPSAGGEPMTAESAADAPAASATAAHKGRAAAFADGGEAAQPAYNPPWLAEVDPARLPYEEERDAIVLNCADALAQMCGMMTLNEAYEAYRSAVLDVVPLERFVAVLMQEDSFEQAEFVLQEWRGQSYLMHFSISDAYAHEWVAREKARTLIGQGTTVSTEAEAMALIAKLAGEVADSLESEMAGLEEYRAHLLECQRRTARRPLDPSAADGTYLEELAARAAMVQLRDFLDAHVPDGEDDYTYADRVIDEVLLHSIDSGDAMGFLDEVERAGVGACTEDPDLFMRLLENAYGSLPSWEFNGWSPQESMERLMGRRIFYNVRGEMMHPALGDACPCGSGKPYGECHGAT